MSGSDLTPDLRHTRSNINLSERAAAHEAETRKHNINDPKCLELGLVYTAYPTELSLYVHLYICRSICIYRAPCAN